MACRCSCVMVAGVMSLILCAAAVSAQTETAGWNVEVATGVSPTVGDTSNRLKTGFNFNVGGGYEFNDMLELEGNFNYNGLGVADQVLQSLKVPDGTGRLMSLTAGPKVHFPIGGSVRGYVAGGIGWYRRTVEFLQPTTALIDIIDPWWGYLGTAIVPANQVLGTVSDNAFGGNVGGGVSVPLGGSGADFFVDVRYHIANTRGSKTSLVPVSFGIRFTGGR
jgi:opacity protein-like surface antigen